MIEFKVKSTTYKVASPEKQALVEQYCSKITKRTGTTKHKIDSFAQAYSSNPKYPCFDEGMSTAEYVRRYEQLNGYRFHGVGNELQSLFGELSTNPQFVQDDSVLWEANDEETE